MDKITVDFSRVVGKMKPMHAVNNGPIHRFHSNDQTQSNLQAFIDAGIPFSRTHDASFCATYGGEHSVDVNNIFLDWNADPYDPESYDFVCTDEYMKCIVASGAKIFYRLGSKIEHYIKKFNTLPPKDFKKWAIVCEHIIRHYTEGWANGYYYDNTYWEIWNEPDLDDDDSSNKRCWGGTAKQFIEFYNVVFNHLKDCFPNHKIGGPAVANVGRPIRGSGDPEIEGRPWLEVFFERIDRKPDFFSWHIYAASVEKVAKKINLVREIMSKYDMGEETESILNEWNYVRGWFGADWHYSKGVWRSIKGAAFIAAVMEMGQYEPIDMLMFYDARPSAMNCLFETEMVERKKKGYYSFYTFNKVFEQGNCVSVERDSSDVWAVAAKGDEQNVMLTYYNDDDSMSEKTVKVEFNNVESDGGVKLEYYLIDETHNAEIVREEIFTSNNFAAYVNMTLNSTYLLRIVKL